MRAWGIPGSGPPFTGQVSGKIFPGLFQVGGLSPWMVP